MQIKLIIRNEKPCRLPISYHHIQQSAIYHLLRETPIAGDLHDHGATYGKRTYKLFTFGPLMGKYEIVEKNIIFQEEIRWEIRSDDRQVIMVLYEKIRQEGLVLGENVLKNVDVMIQDDRIEEDSVYIKMISSICVYSTNPDTKKTYFYSPQEKEFSKAVQDNFQRKYTAGYMVEPEHEIHIEPVKVTPKDKYLTKYKGFYINGWKGIYKLSGQRKYLDFLYQTGIGAKNSQGFGMFEVIPKEQI